MRESARRGTRGQGVAPASTVVRRGTWRGTARHLGAEGRRRRCAAGRRSRHHGGWEEGRVGGLARRWAGGCRLPLIGRPRRKGLLGKLR